MSISTSLRRKAVTAALVALTAGAGVAVQSGTAEARNGRNGMAVVGALAAVAGMAIVAGAAQSHAGSAYAEPVYPEPVYSEPLHPVPVHPVPVFDHDGATEFSPMQYQPPYAPRGEVLEVFDERVPPRRWEQRRYAPARGYDHRPPRCRFERQRVHDGYAWRWQRVQVCR